MRHFFAILLMLGSSIAFGQYKFPEKEFVQELEKRVLAVQLIEVHSEVEENLNETLQETFKTNWNLTPVEFFNKSQIEEIRKGKDQRYAVFAQSDATLEDKRSGYIDKSGRRKHVGFGGAGSMGKFEYVAFSFSHYNFELLLTTDKKEKEITSIGLASADLSGIDYLYVVQQLNRLIENSLNDTPLTDYYDVDRNIKTCEKYTLVLLKDFFKEKDVDKISKNYAFPYKLVDYEEYENTILDKPSNTGYVKIIWSNQHNMYAWIVADAKDGSTLSLLAFGGVKFGRNHKANEIISVKHLSYISHRGGQKINNRYK